MVNHHQGLPFGRIFLELFKLFPSIKQANPSMVSDDFTGSLHFDVVQDVC